MTDFEACSAAFLATFKAQPGAYFHPDIAICDLRSLNEGRGILATKDIPADTDLFIIPRDYVISVENSTLRQKLPDLFDDIDDVENETDEDAEDAMVELPKPWLDLILVMVYEFMHRGSSKWQSYWNVLPESFDTLMFWTDDELAELQTSASRQKIGKKDADKMFQKKILPVVTKFEDVFYPQGMNRLGEEKLLKLAHRMGSLIMAYAFDLERDGGEDEEVEEEDGWAEDREGKMAMGMVPMADMLNADAEFNAHLEHGEKALTMRSLREIKQGEEVLNYYGPLPNSDLLRRYGYTTARHARHDVVELEWDMVKKGVQEVLGEIKETALENEELDESFVLERESGDPDETGKHQAEAKFTTFPEELVDQVTTLTSVTLNIQGKLSEEQKRKLKQTFLQIMGRVLKYRIASYETSAEQDEELLKDSTITERKKMAINVRLGEKRLLNEAEQVVLKLLQKYNEVEETSSVAERPAKKQKTKR